MDEIELSCGLPPGPDFADLAVLAEELGYARVWVFDSAPLWEDPIAHLALAAVRTTRIGLATAVLIPSQRSALAMASSIATVARLSGGRLRACFGTGATSRMAIGRPPMSLDALFAYVGAVRQLLAGETPVMDGKPVRMLHWAGMAAPRPVAAPLWVSVFGPRGIDRAPEVAEGIIGPVHPTLPTATMTAGTVLDPGEVAGSRRVREAIGPWWVMGYHTAYARGGAAAVDAMPGGAGWRAALEELAPQEERHLLTFEGHATHLPERDRALLEHLDLEEGAGAAAARGLIVGDADTVRARVGRVAAAGFRELIYTPSGPDVSRELRAFASVRG
jgi:5,10-methylenetetrahydromethanopterin reductase